MNGLIRSAISALIGGIIGAGIWAGITYSTGMEIGWIAWGVGLVVGLAVRMGCGDSSEGFVPGGVAVVGAILALAVGKYAAIHFLVDNELGDMTYQITADDMLLQQAATVTEEWQAEGKKLAWPRNMNYELAEQPTDYPKAVWKEAKARWESKSAEEQTAEIDAQTEMMDQMQAMFRDQLTKEAFKESFSPIDLLFFGLAIFTAFKLGSGMTDD